VGVEEKSLKTQDVNNLRGSKVGDCVLCCMSCRNHHHYHIRIFMLSPLTGVHACPKSGNFMLFQSNLCINVFIQRFVCCFTNQAEFLMKLDVAMSMHLLYQP